MDAAWREAPTTPSTPITVMDSVVKLTKTYDGVEVATVLPPPAAASREWGLSNIFACVRPILSLVSGSTSRQDNVKDWEIPYDHIGELKLIGRGAQGTVFVGNVDGGRVAIKKVRDSKEAEIKHLRQLDHPNIVKFLGVCTESPHCCIVMEYCPNGSLFNLLQENKCVNQIQLYNWSKGIAEGMHYLHSNKIIHRDLKSPNVLIGDNGVAKVSDFGTCREWNELSVVMSFTGTVAWMAPEMIRNDPCSTKVDVWSFGVVLWELLVCEIPYKNMESTSILWGVGNGKLCLPIPPTCTEEFQVLLKQCWDPNPRSRPTFQIILSHIEDAMVKLLNNPTDFKQLQEMWKNEANQMSQINAQASIITDEEMIKNSHFQMRQAKLAKCLYYDKIDQCNNLYMDLKSLELQLEQREQAIKEKEQALAVNCCQCGGLQKQKGHYAQSSTSPEMQCHISNKSAFLLKRPPGQAYRKRLPKNGRPPTKKKNKNGDNNNLEPDKDSENELAQNGESSPSDITKDFTNTPMNGN